MSNYPSGYEAITDPWQGADLKVIPFDELRFQETCDCAQCGREDIPTHGVTESYLVCKMCYEIEQEYYDEE